MFESPTWPELDVSSRDTDEYSRSCDRKAYTNPITNMRTTDLVFDDYPYMIRLIRMGLEGIKIVCLDKKCYIFRDTKDKYRYTSWETMKSSDVIK